VLPNDTGWTVERNVDGIKCNEKKKRNMQNETKAVRDRLIRSVRGSNDNNRKYNLFAFEKLQDVFLTKYISYLVKTNDVHQ